MYVMRAMIRLPAKILISKHIPKNKFPVKWRHKCLLVLVRRFKSFKDCPEEISYYDWIHAKKQGEIYSFRMKLCLILVAGVSTGQYIKRRKSVQYDKDIEERTKLGYPATFPKYNPLKSIMEYAEGARTVVSPPADQDE